MTCCLSAIAVDPPCAPAPDGLRAWFPFEQSGVDVVSGSNATLLGSPAFSSGRVGQGLRFDGVDDAARLSSGSSLDLGAGPGLTVEMWLNPQRLDSPMALLEWSTTSGPEPGLHLYSSVNGVGTLFANLIDINSVAHHFTSPAGALSTGVFQHVAFTYDRSSGVARFLVNGAQVAQGNFGNLRLETRPDLWFGQRVLGGVPYRFAGTMDEVSLYDRALGSNELQAIYAAGALGKCSTITPPLADGLVVPNELATNDAAFGSGTLANPGHRSQQVYGASEFGSVTGAVLITELRFRPDYFYGRAFSATVSNLQVNLSTTTRPAEGLSSAFASNVGTDDTVVFSGPLSVSSSFSGPANGPKAFDIRVPLSTPFVYQPALGNLLVDIRNFSGSTASLVSGQAVNDGASRVLGNINNASGAVDAGADALLLIYAPTNIAPPPVITPTIVLQPQNTNVLVGQTTILRVGATGTGPLRYQWFFNNLPLPGRTSPFLVLSNVQPSQAGFYFASVSNLAGVTFSSNALLVVNIPSNRPPVAFGQNQSLPEDSSILLLLSGSDPDGNPLTYNISTPPTHGTLSGTPPNVTYTPAPNFNGTDSFQFQVSDAQFTSAPATVTLQITASNDLPTLIATVGLLFPLGNGDTNWYILTTNNTDAPVIFDASLSSDPDGTPLGFLWYLAGETEPFASGTVTTNTLPVGAHEVLVIVNDGVVMRDAPLSFEIVTAGDLLEILSGRISESSLARKDKRPLLEALKKAGSEFDRNKLKQALEKLEHFQKKVRSHVVRHDPELAQEWLAFTDRILDAFGR